VVINNDGGPHIIGLVRVARYTRPGAMITATYRSLIMPLSRERRVPPLFTGVRTYRTDEQDRDAELNVNET